MLEVFQAQNALGIDTAVLTPEEAHQIHPLLRFDDVDVIGYDTRAGYCDPYLSTNAYVQRAKDFGVTFHTDTPVTGLATRGDIKLVTTPNGTVETPTLILIAGPWTNGLARMLGTEFPYEVSRHKVITLRIDQDYGLDWPTVKDLTTPDKIYFRPETGGVVLVGTGDHGDPIEDADTLRDDQVGMRELGAGAGRAGQDREDRAPLVDAPAGGRRRSGDEGEDEGNGRTEHRSLRA